MAGGITHNYINVAGFKPAVAEVKVGEIVINLADGFMWSLNAAGTAVIQIGGGGGNIPPQAGKNGHELATDGTAVAWFPARLTPNLISASFVIPTGTSASLVSGVTIADTFSVTVPDGSTLSIV